MIVDNEIISKTIENNSVMSELKIINAFFTRVTFMSIMFMLSMGLTVSAVSNDTFNRKLPQLSVKRLSPGTEVRTVVIDAGHGGKDPGCHGNFAHEKDICLAIALKLGKLIEEHYPDVKVVYTRKTDVFVELHTRAKIANDNKADLFICIHVNAGGDGKAYGSETYVMGLHRSETNLNVAKRENSVIEFEDDYKKQYEGFDPNSVEGSIIFSLYQNRYLDQSLSFAAKVQHQFKHYAGRHDRGVRQAGFLVLVYTTMPSVLIETGFATHQEEEKFLADPNGQTIMAESIFQAFIDYKKEIERDTYKGMIKEYKPKGKNNQNLENEESEENKNTLNQQNISNIESNDKKIVFKVQFMTSASKISPDSEKFDGIPDISFIESDGKYKYMAGNEQDFNKATELQNRIRSKGYKDAFVVAFQGDQKITIREALDILQKNN